MKIIIISPLPPRKDGVGDYAARLIDTYRSQGHDVAVVTPSVTTIPVPVLGLLSMSPAVWVRTSVAAFRYRPDVVHVQHTIATFGPLLAALWPLVALLRMFNTPVLVTHHEVTRDLGRLGILGQLYYFAVSRIATRVHVHTRAAADILTSRLRLAPWRVVFQPHPVFDLPPAMCDVEEVSRREGLDGKTVLLIFGYVTAEKGTLDAINAVEELLRRQPTLRPSLALIIAGEVRPRPPGFTRFERTDREYFQALRQRTADLDLADVVRFVGHVPDGEVAAWFGLTELVLLPYLNTEGSGVANLAIASGTPVLATKTGGLAELFAGMPMLTSLTAEHFADALAGVLADPVATRAQAEHTYARLIQDQRGDRAVPGLVTSP